MKKIDFATMVPDIVAKPKGGYQGTIRLCHRPKHVWVILVVLAILTIFGIWAKRANFRQKVKKVKKSFFFKLWHVAYQIAGILMWNSNMGWAMLKKVQFRAFWAIFGIWAKRPYFGQKVKKFDFARMVPDIVIKPKGDY